MDRPRDELIDLRREARSDGLNVDALIALVPLLAKYPHDKGAGVLNELIRYAGAFGTELAVANASPRPANDPPSDGRVPEPPLPAVPASAVPTPRPGASAPLRLATQVVVALSVSIGLIWLLN